MENSRATSARSRVGKLVGLVFGLGLFGFVLYQLGLEETLDALLGINGWYLLAACGMFAVSYAVKIGKWYLMQRKAGLNRSLLSIAHLYFGTRVGGLITPMRSGEFIPGLIDKEKGDRVSQSAPNVLWRTHDISRRFRDCAACFCRGVCWVAVCVATTR